MNTFKTLAYLIKKSLSVPLENPPLSLSLSVSLSPLTSHHPEESIYQLEHGEHAYGWKKTKNNLSL